MAPFGDDVGIVVSWKGAVQVIEAGKLSKDVKLAQLFNPASATNRFLTPWASKTRIRAVSRGKGLGGRGQ
jgi:hypothetical protein